MCRWESAIAAIAALSSRQHLPAVAGGPWAAFDSVFKTVATASDASSPQGQPIASGFGIHSHPFGGKQPRTKKGSVKDAFGRDELIVGGVTTR